MSTALLALNNLRIAVVIIVVAVHAVMAYLGSSPASSFAFDDPPYRWRSIPIVDPERWFGFDLFCGFQDIYLISLLFFLSGLFLWPSLARRGSRLFLRERVLRIGVPFALTVGLLMPVAYYPVYLVTAADPGLAAFWRHWLALPFWPSGPPWFLWVLLAFDLVAAGLYGFAHLSGDVLVRSIGRLGARPASFVIALTLASAIAYVPPALVFGPWDWFQFGPFSFQFCRPLHYFVYFLAGAGVGAHGIDRGLLAPDGWLAKRWAATGIAALVSFMLWLVTVGLAMTQDGPPGAVQLLQALSFVPCCAAGVLFMLALFLRFAHRHSPVLDPLRDKTYGIYLIHYAFSNWLQFALLGFSIPATAKAITVFAGTLSLSFLSVAVLRRIPLTGRIGPRISPSAGRRASRGSA
ncbi:acyltransferase [Bradyrhizobium sp.]|uniref:acyltransferase family protein n=1 Tax=Bradyrhizobium sp. TaxID=376 RepID=UPI0023A4274B|nr:acyltransferase [Bradyrhizobium sp.]MDE2378308.1 acyltransferase [Bradyrhizobium sp.]